ncbi:AAA family ATPase [Candidatus Woesearchaeota archaeon]|nr:AAA family ATPase [Candidatus Woesearchaeota archaeon]
MSLFKDTLRSDQSLFMNELALDYDFLPKLLPYRETQQHYLASCIKPLLANRNGRNVFIHGASGIGKTAAVRFVLRDLEEETDEVHAFYVNCWQKNTSYKIIIDICEQLGYRLTHNKKTEELFEIVKGIVNKKCAVFCFDEIDKVEDLDFLYSFLEHIFKKTIILITNHKEWIDELDNRIRSRLLPEVVEFKAYTEKETQGILKIRAEYAFVPNVWSEDAFALVCTNTTALCDIRAGLFLLRQSGLCAEEKSSKRILPDHAKTAIERLGSFTTKRAEDINLEEDSSLILSIIKEQGKQKIGDIFKTYMGRGGNAVYKTFQRRIRKLADSNLITLEKITGGAEGTTSIISYNDAEKKLTEF